jgi:RNA polymerase sigma-70 factor (ECF subfamily)
MSVAAAMPANAPEPTDEDLIARVAAGAQDALGPLYSRYARLVFHLAAQSLERAAAEEITQEVFLVVWRRAELFDRQRGTFRSWVLQITHFRVLNELRRRSRQPRIAPDPDALLVADLADDGAPLAERVAEHERRAAVRAALAALPEAQREALRLAVLESRTHEQVAGELAVPLGTAKTRIRAGLQKLRGTLVARAALLAALALVTAFAVRDRGLRGDLAERDRALTVVTASDLVNLRLAPAAGYPEATHARYRGRTGAPLAVMTFSSFPPAPAGHVYAAWARYGDTWVALGTPGLDATGNGRLIAERPELATLPTAVAITLETSGGGGVPSGPVVASWSSADR